MDSLHQAILRECQSAFALVQTSTSKAEQAMAELRESKRALEVLQYRWCGIVVEQLVSDVLALIAGQLELAKDMRAFRLTCTHWNQSFCENLHVFADVNHVWGTHCSVKSCLENYPDVAKIIGRFFGLFHMYGSSVSIYYNDQGQHHHYEFDGSQFWQMKDGHWTKTKEKEIRSIITRDGACLFNLEQNDSSRNVDRLHSEGPVLQFENGHHVKDKIHIYYHRVADTEKIPDLHFDNPFQADLYAVQQRVIKMIETADRIRWSVREEDLDKRMKAVAKSWGAAVVQRNNPKDSIK